MASLWSCPNPDCPATEFEPAVTPVMGEPEVMAVCGGECGQTYALSAFRQVTAS